MADLTEARDGSKHWRAIIIWVALFQLLVLIHLPALHGPFVFDDHGGIVTNEDLRHWDEPWRLLRDHESSLEFDRRPVTGVTMLLNFQISGLNPFSYRVVNLLLHWFAAMLLAAVVNLISTLLAWKGKFNLGLVVAGLWLVHPIATNVTSYIYQRSELLMSLFYLCAIYFVVRAGQAEARSKLWLCAAAVAAFASALSKEVGLTLVLSFVLIERVCIKRSWRDWLRTRWLFYTIVLFGFGLLSLWFSSGIRVAENMGGGQLAHPVEYFKTQCVALVKYLRMVFWPFPVIFFGQPRYLSSPSEWLPQFVFLSLLFAGLIAGGLKRRWVLIPAGVFLIVLAPTSSFYPIPLETEAGFRMYLPTACVLAFFVVCVASLLSSAARGRLVGIAQLVACVLWFGVATFMQNRNFSSGRALWTSVVRSDPHNIKAWNNLALELLYERDFDQAAAAANRLLAIGKGYKSELAIASGRRVQALVALQRGEIGQAVFALERLSQGSPWLPGIELDLALGLVRANRLSEAEILIEKASEGTRRSPSFQLLLGELYLRQGKEAETVQVLKRLESMVPDSKRLNELKMMFEQFRKNRRQGRRP